MKNTTLTFLLPFVLVSLYSQAQVPEKVADIPNYAFNANYAYNSTGSNSTYYNSLYYSSVNANFTVSNNKLFFTIYDSLSGYELWVTDGSAIGTTMIQIIAPPGQYSYFSNFTSFDNKLYFISGTTLWVSDGTAQGTQKLSYLNQRSYQFLIVWNSRLYLLGSEPDSGYHLFVVTDGSVSLQPVSNLSYLSIINAVLFKNKIYITSADSSSQYLWATDGTDSGTNIIQQVPFINNDYVVNLNLQLGNGQLWFFTEQALWVSDGTSSGTRMVPNSNYYDQMAADYVELENVAVAGDNIYYELLGEDIPPDCGGGSGLEVCNGDSVLSLYDAYLNFGWSSLNGKLYFPGSYDRRGNYQLWASDGTVGGTKMINALLSKPAMPLSSCYGTYPVDVIGGFNAINNNLYFFSADGNNDGQVWIYDVGLDTTEEIIPSNATNCAPFWYNSSFAEYKNAVYYLASYNTPGQELWRINLPTPTPDSVGANAAFSLYPNPARSNINITAPTGGEIFIYNLQGEIIKTQYINPADVVDISMFANGVYFIRNAENTFRAKFVKD